MRSNILLLLILLASCAENHNSLKKVDELLKTPNEFAFLYYNLTGKRFKYNPGNYDRKATRAVYIDRHNEAWSDYVIDSILYEHRLCAKDSNSLKTVVVIYKNPNKFSIDKFIDGAVPSDSSEIIMGYLDLETQEVKKIVSFTDTRDNIRQAIAKKITETF